MTYYHLCHRKLWLLTQEIRMEQSTHNQYVEEGKLINETSYQRRPHKWRELSLEGIKIDHFDVKNNLVREEENT
ncbi:MAG: Dna2/Cas4 domain-containing protein [Saprospiraceae bacterium]|nr:Dna2/Cas4 domain-containing protein [Saprospiraceae bacterium]